MSLAGFQFGEPLRHARQPLRRAVRSADGAMVLLKSLPHAGFDPLTLAALQREFQLLESLDTDGVARAIGFDAGHGTLILDDDGSELLQSTIGTDHWAVREVLAVATQLAAILVELHRRQVIHKNLNPCSILWHPARRRVQLFDFTLATRLAQESQPHGPLGAVQGWLPYLSPEQTGRMNRLVDYRSDLYSLGAVLYALLLGRPPFDSDDPLEIVHGHIALVPRRPHELDATIPPAVSDLVMKLLAKNAEDRYQSAWGVRADLERCAENLAELSHGAVMPLGLRDRADHFTIPQHLYGRESERELLLKAFDRVSAGSTELVFVSGYSGIGKTALVNEVHKPILHARGRFTAGKFDQLDRRTPYGALIQALRGLLRQVLAENEAQLAPLCAQLRTALGANVAVLSAVLPELEALLGVPRGSTDLGASEAQNLFDFTIEGLLGALARAEHPLVIFIDDLQWADAATLRLLPRLVTAAGLRYLLLVAAYRDNEVEAGHPLLKAMAEIRQAGATTLELSLPPLHSSHLTQLVIDALHSDAAEAEGLARLIERKTAGNPFFVTQFLRTLHREGLLTMQHETGRWQFDLRRIEQAEITDNVVDLMTHKLRTLAAETQHLLTLAACIGGTFTLHTLAAVGGRSLRAVAAELWPAIHDGLVLAATDRYEQFAGASDPGLERLAPTYRFLHDRVQQAAYALIPAEQKAATHLALGRALTDEAGAGVPEVRIFEAANHLNRARHLIVDPDERAELVKLNLLAGQRAKGAAAFATALEYLQRGIELLPDDRWHSDYVTTRALLLELAECQYLCGQFEQAEGSFDDLLAHARSPLEKTEALRLRLVQHESMARYDDALSIGLEALQLLGVRFPHEEAEKEAALAAELDRIERGLRGRKIAELVDLPRMTGEESRMIVVLATAIWSAAYIVGDRTLTSLLSARIVRLSLEEGNTAESAYGYVTHAITIGPVRGEYGVAYEWGELALQVSDRFDDRRHRAKIHQQFNAHVTLWRRPLETCIVHARAACHSGLETGDFAYAGYGALTETWAAVLTAQDFARYVEDYAPTVELLRRIRIHSLAAAQELFLGWGRALHGLTAAPTSLSYGDFDEESYTARFAENRFNMTFYFAAKLHLSLIFERYSEALDFARRAGEEAWTPKGMIWPVMFDFWQALALAGRADAEQGKLERGDLETIVTAKEMLAQLAIHCPENYRTPQLILEAELLRLAGSAARATETFDEAIQYARESGRRQFEALASERLAKLCLRRGRDTLAAAAWRDAHRGYVALRAVAKVRDLEARYGQWLDPLEHHVGGGATSHSLDLATVLRMARAIVGEVDHQRLLDTLMRAALQNAGAQRGLLLIERGGELVVVASGHAAADQVDLRERPFETASDLARSIALLVHRSGESVIVDDAQQDPRLLHDEYVARTQPRSILCVPISHQGRRTGLFYLENNALAQAFRAERIEMMQILSGEAAIALENARLYSEMRAEVERRRRAEQAAQAAFAEVERLKDRLQAENIYLQEEIRSQHNFEEIVGNSPALLVALRQIEQVAETDSSVLILGETGVGKELFARAIHNGSRRRARPLVKVNCGAIPAGLVESELFGHLRGAFTGALQNRTGRFELAHGGTIFLDEVGELPLETQTKLLRVLQEREFEPVGSTRTVKVDVRVIAATNRDVHEAVRLGRFRADLLYRLNVFPIVVPPLRERTEDIPLIVGFLLDGLSKRLGKPLAGFSRESMERLMRYSWPGNVRELQNVVERAAIVARTPVLELSGDPLGGTSVASASPHATSPSTLEEFERRHVVSVLRLTHGVVEGPRGAASILGLHPNTLRSRIKKLGIERGDFASQ